MLGVCGAWAERFLGTPTSSCSVSLIGGCLGTTEPHVRYNCLRAQVGHRRVSCQEGFCSAPCLLRAVI